MGFLVVCEAGISVGEHWVPVIGQPWAQEYGQALESWERWLIMPAEIQFLQKINFLFAAPLCTTRFNAVSAGLLLLHPRVAQGIIPEPHLYKQMNCV